MGADSDKKQGKGKGSFGVVLFGLLLLLGGGAVFFYWKKPEVAKKWLKEAKESGQKAVQAVKSTVESVSGNRKVTLKVRDIAFTVEVADTEKKRKQGLMYRKSLPKDYGMIFVYPEPRYLTFWMRNTFVALSLAFLDEEGKILEILQMEVEEPKQEGEEYRQYNSSVKAKYAIEMPKGWFEQKGIQVGDLVEGVKELQAKE